MLSVVGTRTLLIANTSSDVYGSDLQMLESITAMVDRGWRVIVTTPNDGPLVPMIRERGAEVDTFFYPQLRRADASLAGVAQLAMNGALAIRPLAKYIKRVRPEVVYVNDVVIPWWLAACRLARIPSLCHVHVAEESDGAMVRYALNAPLLAANILVFNGKPAWDATVRLFPRLAHRSRLIYNGIPDPGPREPLPDYDGRPFRLVCVARLSPRKGIDVALDSVGELRRRGENVELDLCGTAYTGYEWYETQLRERAARDDLKGAVTFSGYVSPVAPALNRAHAMVAPSLREPFGNAVVEAQLMGRPVVAAAAMGHLETVRDRETGLLVEPSSPIAMADAIQELMRNPAFAAQIARRGQEVARAEYSLERYNAEMAAVIESLAEHRTAASSH